MPEPHRARMSLNIVAATVGGMSLIGWAVEEVLPWTETTALVIGVVLVAYAAANARRAGAVERIHTTGMAKSTSLVCWASRSGAKSRHDLDEIAFPPARHCHPRYVKRNRIAPLPARAAA